MKKHAAPTINIGVAFLVFGWLMIMLLSIALSSLGTWLGGADFVGIPVGDTDGIRLGTELDVTVGIEDGWIVGMLDGCRLKTLRLD